MKFYPTRLHRQFISFILVALGLIISCSKDSDLLNDAIFNSATQSVEDRQSKEEDTTSEEETNEAQSVSEPEVEEEPSNPEDTTAVQAGLENRTTSFPPLHDAYFQSGKGYNQYIVRLEEGRRTSYLMFDLGQIDSIGGQITDATLQFTINSDDGDGTINVYKGLSSSWSENDLTSTPETGVQLGSLIKQYKIGATEEIELNTENLLPEIVTLILDHQDGNDLAFASKEHPLNIGPKLVVSYNAPVDAETIVITEEETTTVEEETNTEEQGSENNTSENEAPMAIADGTPSTGKAPLEVAFKGSNSTDDKDIKSYSWNFKDGSTATGADPTHTFTEVGSYDAVLTVTDDEGLTDTDTVTITVSDKENGAPKAVATATPSSGVAPLEVKFKGSNSTDDNGISSYAWDFKDGKTATNANPSHVFTEAGTYAVQLTVKDENGLSNSKTVTITVTEPAQNEAPKAVATATPSSGVAPLEVQFKGSNSTDDNKVTSYAWDFKDGSNATSANPSHTFAEAGTYAVQLTVKDEEGLSHSKTVTITVTEPAQNEPPKAVATATPTSGEAPLDVQFKGSDSTDDDGIASYAWDFKDGSSATTSNPSHTFNDPGTYNVRLTVKDEEGLSDTKTINITVNASSGGNNGGGNNGNYPSNAVFASSFGFNSNDATSAFVAAINSGSSFVVIDKQSSDWVIKPTKFFDTRDMTIIFEQGVVLRAKSGAFPGTNDILVNLVRPKNLTIKGYGATFRMNKSEYNSGEHRHTLSIVKGNNVTVQGLTLKDSGGDGVIIAGDSQGAYSQNITIEDVICKNNRRQGMTITSAKDVWVRNSQFLQTNGTNPKAGVDLEPDHQNERLVNINFSNCKFSGNDGAGLHLTTLKLNGSSIPISVTIKDSEFSSNAKNSTGAAGDSEVYLSQGDHSNPVGGEIRFERVNFTGGKHRILLSRKAADSYKAVFKDCVAKNVATNGKSPIRLERLVGENTLGNFTFTNFRIEYNTSAPFMEIGAPSSNFTVKNIQGSFTIKHPADKPLTYTGGYNPSKNVNVSINYNHIN